MNSVTEVVVTNVPRNFFLILLVDEDQRIMSGVGGVVLYPISSWMICFFILAVGDCYVGRGGYALQEGRWGSNFSHSILQVWFDLVRKCGHVCQVGDAVIFAISDR